MLGFREINYKRIVSHTIFWIAYILYVTVHDGWQNKDVLSFHLQPQLLTDVTVPIIMAYVNLYLLMPLFYYNQQYITYVISLLILLLTGALVLRFFTWSIWIPWDMINDSKDYLTEDKRFFILIRIIRNMVEAYPIIALTMLIKLMRNSFNQEKRLREIEKERFAAELGLLKAQVNPHFFFNTLNILYALTLKGSDQASNVVLRLSDLMHYMLYETGANKVLLVSEVNHLQNYIAIEQMRFSDRLEFSFQCSGDIEGKFIAPLLLLPFIENAFKHGTNDDSCWIVISIKVLGNRLFFKVHNSYNVHAQKSKEGIGLDIVKKRLELTYPDHYELLINRSNNVFEIDLKMDL